MKDLANHGTDHVNNSPYAKKTMDFYNDFKENNKKIKKQDFSKALMASYGGNSPTSSSGGLVLQSELLEDPKFKYINCEKCGKEQIYAKHQVRCRECGSNFSMEKVYNALSKK